MLVVILGKVTGKLVSPNQTSFLTARMLVDDVMIVNEVIDNTKKSRKHYFIFKMDFNKAYDSVS